MKSVILFTAIALLVSGCGAQQFTGLATTEAAIAPGVLQLAPKVDIVLVEDDTGRIKDQYATINQQTRDFLSQLDNQGWNYRFAVVPLTTLNGWSTPYTGTGLPYALSQAVASKQDPNWAGYWVAPYPGATQSGNAIDELSGNIFRTIPSLPSFSQYNGFVSASQITNVLNGAEPGFMTMSENFSGAFSNSAFVNAAGGKSFFRPDALTAVVLLSTGDDTSYLNMCHRADGVVVPCEQVLDSRGNPPPVCGSLSQVPNPTGYPAAPIGQPYCQSAQLSLNTYYNQLKNLHPGALKFYAAVDGNSGSYAYTCAGGMAKPGSRYMTLANMLGGKSYDICSQSLSSILSDVAQNLTAAALQFEKVYILLKAQPDPTTISVTKYINGDPNQPVTIPMDASNGWTYAGYMANTATIDYPIPMDEESGYMIQLHGSARLEGSDTASVTFKGPTGASYSQ